MAEQVSINLNVKTDDSQKSLRAMRQELKQLQIAMDAASDPAEFDRLARQFAELRNDIGDTSKAMKYMDPGELLSGWTKMAQGAVGSFAAITGAMSLFGNESEEIQEIEKKSMVLIQTMMGLEQLRATFIEKNGRAQLAQLAKTTAEQYKNTAASVANWTAQKAMNSSTMAGSLAFKAMGLAMKAIPFVAVIAGAAALAFAVYKIAASYDTAAKTQKAYDNVSKAAVESSAKETVSASTLAAAIRKNIDNKEELSKLVKKWNDDYGVKYGASLDATKLKLEDVATALDIVRVKLMENAMAAGAAARIEEIIKEDAEAYSKYVEAQSEIAVIRAQKADWLESLGMTDEEYQKMLASTGAADKYALAIADVYAQFGVDDDLSSELDMLFDLQSAFSALGADTGSAAGSTKELVKGIDELRASFYGALYNEMTDYQKKLDDIDKRKKDNLVTEEEYVEGLYIINEAHDRKMLELEKDSGYDSLELDKWFKAKKVESDEDAAANELARLKWIDDQNQKIQEGWYAEEILKREGNFGKRLDMLKSYHEKGLILEEDYVKTVGKLIDEQVNNYSNFVNDLAGGMGDIFSNLTEMMQMELDAQDAAWQESHDARTSALDDELEKAGEIWGQESEQYKYLLEQQKKAEDDKADHDADMEKKRKAADAKYKKGAIGADMASTTAEFAKATAGIWFKETGTKGVLGVPFAIALQAVITGVYASQMALMAKQMGLVGKMRLGGPVYGPSHESGGVDKNLEGGEFVINAQSMKVPGVAQLANSLNRTGQGGTAPSVVDEASVRAIVAETIGGISAIPVVVSERDITGTQRRVAVIESKTSF